MSFYEQIRYSHSDEGPAGEGKEPEFRSVIAYYRCPTSTYMHPGGHTLSPVMQVEADQDPPKTYNCIIHKTHAFRFDIKVIPSTK